MTINQPCVSPGTGTLSPDLRVFYQYGMVLGLDDFLQEQTHTLSLDYHHERALHGYGTVYGLAVTTSTPAGDPQDVEVTVGPGMGIDQWGREVTVEEAQCARIGAWLAAQEEAAPGTVEGYLGLSGELVLYVVAAYADCPDDLVPLPGQPCSTSSQVQVPSRLRDAWDIELRWAPPAMPAWEVIGQLAELLNAVQVVPGLNPSLSSEDELVEAVLALATPATPSGSPPTPPPVYQLPAETADAAFDRILTTWVVDVRPQLAPDLTAPDPSWDPSILLSTLTVTPQVPFSTTSPVILSYGDPDDTGRPYLLSTELIQELRLGGSSGAAAVPPPPTEGVTLSSVVDGSGALTLTSWFHLDAPVTLPATIEVSDDTGATWSFSTSAPSTPAAVWTLTPPAGVTFTDGQQLSAVFPGATVEVGSPAITLATAIDGLGILGADAEGDVTAYVTVQIPVVPPASMPFVTVSFIPAPTNLDNFVAVPQATLELWFHLQPSGLSETVTMVLPSVQVIDDITGAVLFPVPGGPQNPTATAHQNVWTISGPFDTDVNNAAVPAYLRLIFSTQQTTVTPPPIIHFGAVPAPSVEPPIVQPPIVQPPVQPPIVQPPVQPPIVQPPIVQPPPIIFRPEESLAAWIAASGLRYVGWSSADDTIVAFARIDTSPTLGSVG